MSESLETTFALLEKANELLNQIIVKTETLKIETGHAIGNLREVEYIFYRVTSLMSRMGLPPEIDAAIQKLQQMILTVRVLHTTMMYLTAAAGPEGTLFQLILGMVSLIGGMMSVGTMMDMEKPRY